VFDTREALFSLGEQLSCYVDRCKKPGNQVKGILGFVENVLANDGNVEVAAFEIGKVLGV